MKILLLKDVYKLGRAGDVKKVAGGYGRNYLIPNGLAVLATPGSLKNVERIKTAANENRTILNKELGGLATKLNGHQLAFSVRASETGKLFGSITTRVIANALNEEFESEISHRTIETEPLRSLGVYQVSVRLTIDLASEIQVVVYREGESIESAFEIDAEDAEVEEGTDEDVATEEGADEDADTADEAPPEDATDEDDAPADDVEEADPEEPTDEAEEADPKEPTDAEVAE